MKDYKLLFLKTIAPVNQSPKEDVNFTVFDVALAVRGGNDQKQNILQGAPKVAAVELQVSTQLLETQSDVEQKKGMRPLLKTQNYPRIITSKYIQKNNKSTLCASNQQKNQNLQLSTFFLFLCCCNGVSHPFFSHSPKKHGKHTPFQRGNTISAAGTWCVTFSSVSSSHPSRSQPDGFHDVWVIQVNGYSILQGCVKRDRC